MSGQLETGEPRLLQTEQLQFPQSCNICFLVPSPASCSSLHILEQLNNLLTVKAPKLNTTLKVWSDQHCIPVDNDFPSPTGHAISDAGQDGIGILGHLGTALAHV